MVNFIIVFDRLDRHYNPADRLNLQIRCQVNSVKKYRSIHVMLQGFAQRDGKAHTERITYYAHESYFKNYLTLSGSQGGPVQRLSAGFYVYNASFQLSQNLPQNHEDADAYIRYQAKVRMDLPWGFDVKEIANFFVCPSFNLNEFPHLQGSVRAQAQKTFGCCCWESEPLCIYNVLPRLGYVPGDHVKYMMELNNKSNVSIYIATVKLIEKIVYHVRIPRYKYRVKHRTLWQHQFYIPCNKLMQDEIFSTDLYFNPDWRFHFFNGSGIITVEYYFKSEARVSGCHTDLSNRTTITMGTIPFANNIAPMASMFPNVSIPYPVPVPSPPTHFASAPLAEPISKQPLPSYNHMMTKPSIGVLPTGIGWAVTPPPTFTEFQLMDEKEKPTEKQ